MGPMDFLQAQSLTPEVAEAIEESFDYQDWSPEKRENGRAVRAILAQAVKVIVANVPPCHDRTAAIHKILESRMYANAGITNGGRC
jgi:hypothetical protein